MKQTCLMALFLAAPLIVMAQTAVFTDTFGSSTTNQTSVPSGTPSASSTSYDIASTKAATGGAAGPYCHPGDLRLSLNAATGSGVVEAQAKFAAAPLALATVGDYINLTYTFTNTTGTLLAGGNGSYLWTGLYNSAGALPLTNLANSGLNATVSTSPTVTNNCAFWQGYVSRISQITAASQVYTRPQQTTPTNATTANQDLVGNGAGGGLYLNPLGIAFGGNETVTLALTSGAVYTNSFTIALTDVGVLTMTNNLFDSTGTLIFSQTNAASGTTNITSSFDGLAIGVRTAGGSFNPTMDISRIAVTASIFGSPGPSFNVTGGGSGCPGDAYLISLSGSVTTNSYFLYTNGVYDGAVAVQTGTGSSLTFGPISVIGTNTIVASNTISGNTGLMSGAAVISILPAPVITSQPASVFVTTNGVALFTVAATGTGLHYQWYKNGGSLTDGGNVSGAQTTSLTISPATTSDSATIVNGYYVVITNNCGLATTSTTNALILQPPGKIVWQGGNPNTSWDLATTPNWTNSAGSFVVFNSGDIVTFDDTSINPLVTMVGNLAPSSVTFNASQNYFLRGAGSLIGTGSLLVNGPGTLSISNVSTYTYSGGTIITNGGTIAIRSGGVQSLGTGPVTLGGGTLEIGVQSGGIPGLSNNISVTANSTLKWDGGSTFAVVLSAPLTGSPSATLTLQSFLNNTATPDRVRLYAAFTNDSAMVINSAGDEIDLAPYLTSGNQVYNGVISGNGGRFVLRGAGNAIFNGANTFNDSGISANGTGAIGYSMLISGGNLGIGADSSPDFSAFTLSGGSAAGSSPLGTGSLGINTGPSEGGNASIFASGGAHTVANPVKYTTANTNFILSITGSNNLTLSGPIYLNGVDNSGGTNRIFQVSNTGVTTFSGQIRDSNDVDAVSLVFGLTKTGAGKLVLSGINTYTGPTLVGAGTLLINGQINTGAVTVTNGTLGGIGTILGPVNIQTPGVLAPGTTSIGTLTVNNNLTLAGNALFKVNKSLSPAQSNDVANVSGALSASGTGALTVTNLGSALVVGDSFKLFNTPVSGGGALTVTGGGVNWTNTLALDGSIKVLSIASSLAGYSTNISATLNGNTLTISWPATHLGWELMVQTNTLATGLGNNWVTNYGTASVTATNFVINPANGTVFYKLVHP